MDDNLVVDLEGRANPGRKTTHGEMTGEDQELLDVNPEILEMRYLKARSSSYRPDMNSPQETEAANLAQFRAMTPEQQLAMVKYLEHMGNYVRVGESMASVLAKIASAKGLLEPTATEDQGFITEAGRLLSPVLSFLPQGVSNILCVAASVIPHLPKMQAAMQRARDTGDPRHYKMSEDQIAVSDARRSAQAVPQSVVAELVVDIPETSRDGSPNEKA